MAKVGLHPRLKLRKLMALCRDSLCCQLCPVAKAVLIALPRSSRLLVLCPGCVNRLTPRRTLLGADGLMLKCMTLRAPVCFRLGHAGRVCFTCLIVKLALGEFGAKWATNGGDVGSEERLTKDEMGSLLPGELLGMI